MNQENIYWLFSSSAQTVSAFVAFLLTGFALVHTIMDSLQQRDDTLEEIHAKLKSEYYERIKVLSFITGLAILSSLTMVYFNAYNFRYKGYLIIIVSLLNILAILGGILFVISIIDPNKYKKAAKEIIREDQAQLGLTGRTVEEHDFIQDFITLERTIRDYVRERGLLDNRTTVENRPPSFRQLVQTLYYNQLIDTSFYEELLQISKYRNLVFHGHIDTADQAMVDKVQSALARIQAMMRDNLPRRA